MSGGTFDYFQYRINDAVNDIEKRLSSNGQTILEHWEGLSDEERSELYEYQMPWTESAHPIWVDADADRKADEALGISKAGRGGKSFNKLTKDEIRRWNDIRNDEIRKINEEHNNSPFGDMFSEQTVAKIREMLPVLKKAKIYLDRIDWLFAGDDGEDSFLKRTEEELAEEGLQ